MKSEKQNVELRLLSFVPQLGGQIQAQLVRILYVDENAEVMR